ncbi:hypothetical protein AA309_26245 [Microvirga vignae]|uniref:RNA polymerase alpha subunit C-terminal domain-containing protein n=1 Tax=Microvirga vignae TaxID=1225564 RepID=A0A0H1RCQ3_9HYPH|nr:hypothetical protein [Microvirga vignae]KLK90367.1 hypothetical protein AA309_26245 [Microvirga vignae]
MPNHYQERWEGPIGGLRLPFAAWKCLQDEGIKTIDQLKAKADRLEKFVGIGPRLAHIIRQELARMEAAERQTSDEA